MSEERRRYFRITENIGVSYSLISNQESFDSELSSSRSMSDVYEDVDQRILTLISEVEDVHPELAELIMLMNQKLERTQSQLFIESDTVSRLAGSVRESNISACGIAFTNDVALEVGSTLALELELLPEREKIFTHGRLISCSATDDDSEYYWRIDFFGMNNATQEQLIQYIVRSQSLQLKQSRVIK